MILPLIGILMEIRQPYLKAGVSSLKVSLSSPKALDLKLTVENPTKKRITIWQAAFWPNNSLAMTDSRGKPAPRTKKGQELQLIFDEKYMNRDKNFPVDIPARKSYAYEVAHCKLSELFALKPGTYSLTVEYWERIENPLRMKTKPIRVTVAP